MIASSESPLYQPSIQVSTILMPSSPPSRNCLQLMVDRSSTTAFAGAEANSMAANRIDPTVFIVISFGKKLAAIGGQQADSRIGRQRHLRRRKRKVNARAALSKIGFKGR